MIRPQDVRVTSSDDGSKSQHFGALRIVGPSRIGAKTFQDSLAMFRDLGLCPHEMSRCAGVRLPDVEDGLKALDLAGTSRPENLANDDEASRRRKGCHMNDSNDLMALREVNLQVIETACDVLLSFEGTEGIVRIFVEKVDARHLVRSGVYDGRRLVLRQDGCVELTGTVDAKVWARPSVVASNR